MKCGGGSCGGGTCGPGGGCGCRCHSKVTQGVLIALFGLVFLLGARGVLSGAQVATWWPVVVILFGVKKAASTMCKCCK